MVSWSVYTMHRRKDYYGEDADEFKPERWETLRPGWVRSFQCQSIRYLGNMLTLDRSISLSTADQGSALVNSSRLRKLATLPFD